MDPETIEISTKTGRLKGLIKQTYENSFPYYSFQGIPYAKPPVGDLRFKAPEPYGQWESVLDATKEGNDAIQKHAFSKNIIGDEDCLYLNIYTPQKPGENGAKKAVMVFIHGGGFSRGSGSTEIYGPDFLIEEDIILVTINYRCGALGFLSLENESVPGNFGLKDQVMALCWVRDNISSFGGDPNNVTIFGESAGASSVNYHLLSPLSRGLFHKAIIQSGTSLCQWAFQSKPREKAFLLASSLGCTSQDDETVLKFLKSVSASEIIKHQETELMLTEKEKFQKLGLVFLPCVEAVGSTSFLPDYPRKILESGEFSKVPVIMGVNDKEGLVLVAIKEVEFERVNKDLSLMVPHDLNIPAGSEEERALGKEILEFYTNKNTLSWEIDDIKGFVDFITDVDFTWANENVRKYFLKHSACPVYSYVLTYTSPRSLLTLMMQMSYPDIGAQISSYGACHADELGYLFKSNLPQIPFIPPSPDDKVTIKKFVKAWSTFAKTGDPNCEELGVAWQPDNIQNPTILDIGKISKVTKSTFPPKQEQFWNKIYEKYSYLY